MATIEGNDLYVALEVLSGVDLSGDKEKFVLLNATLV